MNDRNKHVCPVEIAGSLDNRVRKWLQDPRKILRPHIVEGMTVLDLGCGPGFFSVAMAQLVGRSGRVIAADLQEGMLRKLGSEIQGTELAERITLHKCEGNKAKILHLEGTFRVNFAPAPIHLPQTARSKLHADPGAH